MNWKRIQKFLISFIIGFLTLFLLNLLSAPPSGFDGIHIGVIFYAFLALIVTSIIRLRFKSEGDINFILIGNYFLDEIFRNTVVIFIGIGPLFLLMNFVFNLWTVLFTLFAVYAGVLIFVKTRDNKFNLKEKISQSTKLIFCLVIFIALSSYLIYGYFYGAQSEHFKFWMPSIISSSSYKRAIENSEGQDASSAYYVLEKRKDPIAVEQAVRHLKTDDEYLWLNAAIYLGKLKRDESVPYLIKSLRHTADLRVEERARMLEEITGEKFGMDFQKWKTWWEDNHPKTEIKWRTNLGHDKAKLKP